MYDTAGFNFVAFDLANKQIFGPVFCPPVKSIIFLFRAVFDCLVFICCKLELKFAAFVEAVASVFWVYPYWWL